MEQDVQAEIDALNARVDIAADALTQVSEQLLIARSNVTILRAMLGALVNLSPPEVREAFKQALQDIQPPDAVSGLPREEMIAAREQLLTFLT